jgi:hypothetical protein
MSQVADKYFLQEVVGLLVWIFNQLKTFQRFALPPNGLCVIQRGTMHSYQDHDHGVFHNVNKDFLQSINVHVFVFQHDS